MSNNILSGVIEPILGVVDLRKSFGHFDVLRGVSLSARQGDVISILGSSGSGKSTLLRCLNFLETPSSGEIWVGGSKIEAGSGRAGQRAVNALRRNLGMVFQGFNLWQHMTVLENVCEAPIHVLGLDRAEVQRRAEALLLKVGLADKHNAYPSALSGGQQQRIAVARALVFDPRLVLMDEPLGALDKQLREQMQYEIKRIHQRLGVTIVYVTHDQGEALTMSDTIAVFNLGKIQQLAKPDDIYETPSNSFVAQFIGENNVIAGTIAERNGEICRVRLDNGETLNALDVTTTHLGGSTLLSIRPERIAVDPAPDERHARIKGEVVDQIYVGDHSRIRVRAFGTHEFVVKVQNATLRRIFAKGEPITLGWLISDCRALDPASSSFRGAGQ